MMLRRATAEGLGTFFLVFIGTGAVLANDVSSGAVGAVGIALAFGFVVMAMIYAIGHVSGAHLNPAVTIGFWAARRFPRRMVPWYIAAQILGAVSASLLLSMIRSASAIEGSLGVTQPSIPVLPSLTIEFLLTFALMFVIMAVATDPRAPQGFAGWAIGSVVVFGSLMGGGFTGASMNPARSFGPALVQGVWGHHWIYWLAPIAAAIAAAHCYEWLRDAEAHDHSTKRVYGVEGPLSEESGGDESES